MMVDNNSVRNCYSISAITHSLQSTTDGSDTWWTTA